jgi:hypothetical protein
MKTLKIKTSEETEGTIKKGQSRDTAYPEMDDTFLINIHHI